MIVKRLLGPALLLAASLCAAMDVVPGVIVVQTHDKQPIVDAAKKEHEKKGAQGVTAFDRAKFETSLVPLSLDDITAQELDEDGRLTPIVWSVSDPIFRAAVEDRVIPTPSDPPVLEEVFAAMPKLKAGYVLRIFAFASEGQVWTHAVLYKGNKDIWTDAVRSWQSQIATEFDAENAKRSIARTWAQVLGAGPLKDLPKRVRAGPSNPPASIQAAPPPDPIPAENKQLLIEAMKLMAAKQYAEAVNLLRDAVDAAPADFERRSALVSALLQIGDAELAAREARRAAHLVPEKVEFWVMAARAWIEARNPAEATMDLNEAVARDPENPATRLLLGEVQIAEGRLPLAAEHLEKALAKSPSAYGFRLLAFVSAGLGSPEKMAEAWTRAGKEASAETPEEASRRERLCLRASLKAGDIAGTELRSLIQRLRLAPGDEAAKASLQLCAVRCEATSAYWVEASTGGAHQKSSGQLFLALKLLVQACRDLSANEKPDEDALTEATINLGEALKALKAAQAEFMKELG